MYPIVKITWRDSYGINEGGWVDVDDIPDSLKEDAVCTSVGYLIDTDDKFYTLSGDISPEEIGRLIRIPRSCVIGSVEELEIKLLGNKTF